MSNKQSSVEWLAEQLKGKMQMWNSTKNYQEFHIVLEAGEFAKLIEQAKAMHKEEVKEAFNKGHNMDKNNIWADAEWYYVVTFGE